MLNDDMILSLKSGTFSALQEDFDGILGKTIGNMEMRGAEEATITLKLGISLEKTSVTGPNGAQDITKPSFKHDISSVMQVKDKKSGALTGDFALVWDESEGKFVMRRIDNGQMNIFDGESALGLIELLEATQGGSEKHEGNDTAKEKGTEPAASEFRDASKTAYDPYDPDTPFGWIHQFIGQGLCITEAMGNYTVRNLDNKVVLSSATDPRSPFYCSEEKLKNHVGHTLTCIGSPEYEDLFDVISIWCQDCDEKLFEIKRPSGDDYEYDDPESDTLGDEE